VFIARPFKFRLLSYSVSAGFPSAAEGYEEDPLDFFKLVVRNKAATFCYRVKGDELRAHHVFNGSILVVDKSLTPTLGKLILARNESGFVVCRFQKFQRLVCIGVVIASIKRF
jgi:DNA polymerase V